MSSKAVEALTTMSEISNRQTAQIVELAIAFGAVQAMATRMEQGSHYVVEYGTSDITEFLKTHSVAAEEHDGRTYVTVTRRA